MRDLIFDSEIEKLPEYSFSGNIYSKHRELMKDEGEKCVSCIKSGMKYCAYGETAAKCCPLLDFSPHCQVECSN